MPNRRQTARIRRPSFRASLQTNEKRNAIQRVPSTTARWQLLGRSFGSNAEVCVKLSAVCTCSYWLDLKLRKTGNTCLFADVIPSFYFNSYVNYDSVEGKRNTAKQFTSQLKIAFYMIAFTHRRIYNLRPTTQLFTRE